MKQLAVLPDELLLIEAVLSPSEISEYEHTKGTVYKDFLLHVGAVLVHGHIDFSITEEELWILRERINVFAAVGNNLDVGLRLKKKIYALLLEFDADNIWTVADSTSKSDTPWAWGHYHNKKGDE